jgi:hypothetical protein
MAQRRFTPACRWLIEQKPDLLRKLPREGLFTLLGDSERLHLQRVRLLVPDQLRVYHLTRKLSKETEVVFVAQEDLYAEAYASIITPKKDGGLNYARNVGKLLDYPWLDNPATSRLIVRIYNNTALLIQGTIRNGKHPLSN